MDVHTRKLRYFVAVAEELNFTRAAARLFVAQQALSKQIRELESSLEVALFRRTSRRVELTAAGEALLPHARTVLDALDDSFQAAWRSSGRHVHTLRLGFIIGAALELTAPLLSAFNDRYPAVKLEMREYAFTDPSIGLADGSSDIALLRPPIGFDGYDFEPLFHEPVVAMLSARHPLADRTSLRVQDLLDQPIAIGRSTDPTWQDYWLLTDHRDGVPPPSVLYTSTQTEELEMVAAGLACSITAAASARYTSHPNVRCIRIEDLQPSTLGLGWRHNAREPAIAWFLQVAQEVRDRETEIIHQIEHPSYLEASAGG